MSLFGPLFLLAALACPAFAQTHVVSQIQPARLKSQYEARIARDRKTYTAEQLVEIEKLYQAIGPDGSKPGAAANLKVLTTAYRGANRTGCALLNFGMSLSEAEGEQYLKNAIADYSDSWYGNLLQVGAIARLALAGRYARSGRSQEAAQLYAELERDFPDAIDSRGEPLLSFPGRAPMLPAYSARGARDREIYTPDQLQDIERLYAVAVPHWNTDMARRSLTELVTKYPKANRAGCAFVYLAQMSVDEIREGYLRAAIAQHSDAMYGDGVQVGAIARFMLAQLYEQLGKSQAASALLDEVRTKYPGAIGHRRRPLLVE